MIKFLYKINKKYDQIKEPKRFFTFMAICVPVSIIMAASHPGDTVGWIGFVYLIIIFAVRMSYLQGWLNRGKDES